MFWSLEHGAQGIDFVLALVALERIWTGASGCVADKDLIDISR